MAHKQRLGIRYLCSIVSDDVYKIISSKVSTLIESLTSHIIYLPLAMPELVRFISGSDWIIVVD